jgi:hypothetical protein
MARATIGTRGAISGLEGVVRQLQNLSKNLRSDPSLGAIDRMQNIAFEKLEEAVYGVQYGTSLAEIFHRTRPKGSMAENAGTPVRTGRLQNALVVQGAPYSIFERNRGRRGHFSVTYGADPQDPTKGNERYFPRVEAKYGFFAEGLDEFERTETMKNLSADLAQVFSKEVRNRLARQIRSGR